MIVRNSPFPSQVINPPNDNKKVNDDKDNKEVVPQNAPTDSTEASAGVDKVSDIKQRIEDGAYQIDINKTADKMAQDLLLDIRVYRDSRNL